MQAIKKLIRSQRIVVLAVIMTVIMLSASLTCIDASALSIPKVTIDQDCLDQEFSDNVVVTGTVSQAKGQTIDLIAKDGKTVLSQTMAGTGGKSAAFKLYVPSQYTSDNAGNGGTLVIFVQSRSSDGIAASKKVKVSINIRIPKKSQTIRASNLTLTNLDTSAKIGAKASSGLGLTYKSSNPKIVTVNSAGKITRKKNGKVNITISQAGNGSYTPASKTITVTSRKSTKAEQIDAAVEWAKKIANDNSFTYGSGEGAHHNGCYFCGTNYGPRKKMKPSKKYKKTYCCNPFIHAAYAHGAQNPKMLEGCRKASAIAMTKDSFYRFDCWKCVNKPSYSNLKKGDVLVKSSHVAMYIGNGKMVEARGNDWSAGSIAVRKMSKSRYGEFSFVMRYTGY